MTNPINEHEFGGFAFPTGVDDGNALPSPGMTLHDWYVGMALNGLASARDHGSVSRLVEDAITMADEVIKKRNQRLEEENP